MTAKINVKNSTEEGIIMLAQYIETMKLNCKTSNASKERESFGTPGPRRSRLIPNRTYIEPLPEKKKKHFPFRVLPPNFCKFCRSLRN